VPLDPDICYRALGARDPRFDGRFYVGVVTTGIYCRTVCPARTPRRARCRFFRNSAEAEHAGFRACFRCRPELAPGGAPIDALPRLVERVVQKIDAGALASSSLASIAHELGVTERHLRRAFTEELGVAPIQLAQSRRLALAKQLVVGGRLPLTEVAFASGFRSVRRFNAAFAARFGRPPSEMRAHGDPGNAIKIALGYREPFDWPGLLRFFATRALRGVELFDDTSYRRTVRFGDDAGTIRVTRRATKRVLEVEISDSLARHVMPIAARVRRSFDLDADPIAIAACLSKDRDLARILRTASPRLPGAFDGFELAVRGILGQQISVRGACTLHARLVERFGDRSRAGEGVEWLHPTPAQIAALDVAQIASIGLPAARARSIHALAQAIVDGRVRLEAGADPDETDMALAKVPGFGPWTRAYVLMRGLAVPDSFPDGDLGLLRGFGGISRSALVARAESWRPWRAYAAILIWSAGSGG